MKLLAIDASTERLSLALSVGEEYLTEEKDKLHQHAQSILPMIEALLAKASFSLQALDGIVFGRGPGSFTGLRIACSVAKGLAYAHDLPVFPVSGLAAIADHVQSKSADTAVLAMLDARMNQVYWSYFGPPGLQGEEKVTDAHALIVPPSAVIIAGLGFEAYEHDFPSGLKALVLEKQVVYPHASAMLHLVESGKIVPVSAAEALPVYVRDQVVK